MKQAPLVCAGACAALIAACSEDRARAPSPPVYDVAIASIFEARCVACHGDTNPAGGWRATSFLGAIACVAPASAPAALPPDDRAPILAALDTDPHRGLLSAAQRVAVTSWIAGGTPAFQRDVHDPSIIDPRSSGFHGSLLRASRWTPMLDAKDPNACGRCHEGSPARPAGVNEAAPGAPSCTSCHDQAGGVLACSTCHGAGTRDYPPRDPCFFPSDVAGAHAAHAAPSGVRSTGLACSTCHPMPGASVIGGLHGNGIVEVTFDPASVPGEASYDRSTGACAVSCHDRGGANPRVIWTAPASAFGCGDCHRSPPSGHYTGPCTGCHAEANASGTSLSGGPLHMNGKVDLGDGSGQCGACHGTGDSPWPATAAHRAHENPALTEPLACSNCHVVPATIIDPAHLDGTVHVAFTGLATARGALPIWSGGQCSNVACHGADLADPAASPVWNDVSGAPARCGACHGIPPSDHTASASCDRSDCHGTEVMLDANGAPHISANGRAMHIDGMIESAR